MPLLSLRNLSLAYGAEPLLDGVDLDLEAGERVCLLGRNGAGKSTLLRIIAGELQADSGEVRLDPRQRAAKLAQEAPLGGDESVLEVVAAGLGNLGALVAEYHRLSHALSARVGTEEGARASSGEAEKVQPSAGTGRGPDPQPGTGEEAEALERLAAIQHRLEADGGWELEQRAERVITRLGLDAEARYGDLSGGWRRRVLLAQALVREPDLLLLDEPTNHLDIEAIEWLEEFLLGFRGALLFITHDRRFLRRLATRILELDRGQLTDWPGDYANYLRRREERWHAEDLERARFDKKLAAEEVWIRQGVQARRTRNEGRVRALQAMRSDRQDRRERGGQARLRIDSGERSGKLVVETEALSFTWDGSPVDSGPIVSGPIVSGLNTTILRGDRVGIIGPNGAGKTTLLKLLLGELEPSSGNIRRGTRLQIAYFDQLRAQLNPSLSVCDNLAGGRERIEIAGSSQHVLGYLKDFLFEPDRARQPVSALSGGERNRLLLAKLFTLPANLLVLDEPTNDLDAETLELLEERLHEFDGTLLIVSHDRELLDNLVTSTLVFEAPGQVVEYVGGYQDWLRQRQASTSEQRARQDSSNKAETASKPPAKRTSTKLGYKDQRELDALPAQIEALEQEQQTLEQQLADPSLYQRSDAQAKVAEASARLEAVKQELTDRYARWELLEEKREACASG
ncbi:MULTISPECIES: ATP-binding cassette domain-containing protein [Thiorhodovibrio]|uniref:ATP-binding cassette domain-containing protein n=1 Tax=Thiorhodovibrio TaxID=61593 RepID=UPI0019142164|nr:MULTISPECIES: ATP-binding cassette domain-containing protein [Thiorhodovibrio]MBK5968028.1 ABC transporter ATP-binding protein [Thiorhodovibrio winogradskyi]WPL11844.1 ABC transporter ATP-binding protein uup [Thiorhodovibrio litoralis]